MVIADGLETKLKIDCVDDGDEDDYSDTSTNGTK